MQPNNKKLKLNPFPTLIDVLAQPYYTVRYNFLNKSYITLALTLTTLTVFLIPNSSSNFSFDSLLIIEGHQWWRIFSAPFSHRNIDHLTWNLITLISSSLICEQINRRHYIGYLLLALFTTSFYKLTLGNYTSNSLGFSNIASGSFAFLLLLISRQGYTSRDLWLTLVPLAMLITFVLYETTLLSGPTMWELFTGSPLSGAPGIKLKSGHIVGILTGIFAGLSSWLISYIK